MTSKLPLLRCPRCKRMDLFDIGDGRTMLCNYCEWSGDVSLMIAEKQEPSQCEKDFKEEIEFQKWFQGKQEPLHCPLCKKLVTDVLDPTDFLRNYIPVSKIEELIKQYENIHYNKPNPEWIIRIEELKRLLPKK